MKMIDVLVVDDTFFSRRWPGGGSIRCQTDRNSYCDKAPATLDSRILKKCMELYFSVNSFQHVHCKDW